jgi:periplasmic protein TonB
LSDLGSLSGCMLENDVAARRRARKLRQKALVASILLEAAVLGAMLLWPLITPGVLPGRFNVTPAPPYHGGGDSMERRSPSSAHPPADANSKPRICLPCAPAMVPNHLRSSNESAGTSVEEAPSIGDGEPGGPSGDGPIIPGGIADGKPAIEIRRPSPPAPPAPLRMSAGVMEAALIHKVLPSYPAMARANNISGTVQLRAIIAADGSVRQVDVISGSPLLVPAAVAAVREWRYRPTRLNGEAVEVETLITVKFVMNQQ